MFRHHFSKIVSTVPADNLSVSQHIVYALAITAGIIGIMALIVYIWADYEENEEIDALLKKNGIDMSKTRT